MADERRQARHHRRVRQQRDAQLIHAEALAQARRRRRQQAALVRQQLHQPRGGWRSLRVPRQRLCAARQVCRVSAERYAASEGHDHRFSHGRRRHQLRAESTYLVRTSDYYYRWLNTVG